MQNFQRKSHIQTKETIIKRSKINWRIKMSPWSHTWEPFLSLLNKIPSLAGTTPTPLQHLFGFFPLPPSRCFLLSFSLQTPAFFLFLSTHSLPPIVPSGRPLSLIPGAVRRVNIKKKKKETMYGGVYSCAH